MLSLSEVLMLDKKESNIKKVDLFINNQVINSKEYIVAISYKALILHKINRSNDSLKLLFEHVNNFRILDVDSVISICDAIVEIYLDENRFDEALKYINIKKNFLPMSKSNLYIRDKVNYFLRLNDITEAKKSLLAYLEDDITRDEQVFAKEELLKIYYKQKEYDKVLELAIYLDDYYQTVMDVEKRCNLDIIKLRIAIDKENYIKVVTEINKLLETELKEKNTLILASLAIKALTALGDYKKAGVFESYYVDYLSNDYLNESIEFCENALEFYKKINSKISINEYETKLNEYISYKNTLLNKQKKHANTEELITTNVELKTAVIEHEEVILPDIKVLNPTIEKVETSTRVKQKNVSIQEVYVTELYEKLGKLFTQINSLSPDLKFREIFRLSMISVAKATGIKEAYLLYYDKGYKGFHYKVERVYDKTHELEEIENTINYKSLERKEELFFDEASNEFNINIVTKVPFLEGQCVYTIPLSNNKESYASIAYLKDGAIIDQMATYEILKLYSEFINIRLLSYFETLKNNYTNEKLYYLSNNMTLGIKEENNGYIHLSKQAVDILGSIDDLTFEDYIIKMKSNDVVKYRQIQERLYNLEQNIVFEYDYKKDDKYIRIQERFYPMMHNGQLIVLSIIDDISVSNNKIEELKEIAYNDPVSRLATLFSLTTDLDKEYETKKLSLAIFEALDFSIYKELYGYNFSNQLIFAIALNLKNIVQKDFNVAIYHLEQDRFAILFKGNNDKRYVDAKLKEYFQALRNSLNDVNKRVNLYFRAGVYRLGKNTELKRTTDIIDLAFEALYDARDEKIEAICHYDNDKQKQRFTYNNLVTHISESIDTSKISLWYKQIVDIKQKNVFGYYVHLNLDNYDCTKEMFDEISRRKDVVDKLLVYKINKAYNEQKMFHDVTKAYLGMFIEIESEGINEKLYSMIIKLLQYYKIPAGKNTLVFDSTNNKIAALLRSNGFLVASRDMMDVFRNNCDYFMFDHHNISLDNLNEIKDACLKHNIRFITTGVDKKEELEYLVNYNFDLVYGEFYKKVSKISDIIEKLK